METNNGLEWPWKMKNWEMRSKMISEIIPPEASVINLGSGLGYLKEITKAQKFVSVDIQQWTEDTVVADFNKNEFPDLGYFDIIICDGLIEYIDEPDKFLESIKKYGRRLLITYKLSGNDVVSRKNRYNFKMVLELIVKSGWELNMLREVTSSERIYICTR